MLLRKLSAAGIAIKFPRDANDVTQPATVEGRKLAARLAQIRNDIAKSTVALDTVMRKKALLRCQIESGLPVRLDGRRLSVQTAVAASESMERQIDIMQSALAVKRQEERVASQALNRQASLRIKPADPVLAQRLEKRAERRAKANLGKVQREQRKRFAELQRELLLSCGDIVDARRMSSRNRANGAIPSNMRRICADLTPDRVVQLSYPEQLATVTAELADQWLPDETQRVRAEARALALAADIEDRFDGQSLRPGKRVRGGVVVRYGR